MPVCKGFLLVLFSTSIFSCGGASSGVTGSGDQNSNPQLTISPPASVANEVILDGDEQWSLENNESNRAADVLTPPNGDSALAFDSDANWSPDGPLLEEEGSPDISPVDDDREIPIDSDLNWQKSKS